MQKNHHDDNDAKILKNIAEILEQHKLTKICYQVGDLKIEMERQPAVLERLIEPVGTHSALPTDLEKEHVATNTTTSLQKKEMGKAITSPFVGTVYLSPSPDAKPFVEEGADVEEGDTVLIVESMKVMTPIPAVCSGRIERILINNGEPVEYGQELIRMTPSSNA